MPFQCEVCGKVFSRFQNLKIHKSTHEREKRDLLQPQKSVNFDSDLNSRLNMVEDAIEYMNTGSGFINSNYRTNPYMQLQQQPVQLPAEDSFDKLLKQYMQIMMIKQLSQATNSNTLTDLVKFQQFLDNRELNTEESQDPLTQILLNQLLPSFIQKKKGLNDNMQLPDEEDLLKMSDDDILKILQPFVEKIKLFHITKEKAFENIKMSYPNFPYDRFEKLWIKLMDD